MKKPTLVRKSAETLAVEKWCKNAILFFAPAIIVFLGALSNGVPVQQAMYTFYLYALNLLIDLLKKYSQTRG